jgi:hypothetical protein
MFDKWNWGYSAQSRYLDFWSWNTLPYKMRKESTPWTPNMSSGLGIEIPAKRNLRRPGLAKVVVPAAICLLAVMMAVVLLGL